MAGPVQRANKVAIATGGGTGIGAAIAETFAREGARVAITDRRTDMLDDIVGRITAEAGRAVGVSGSVTHEADVRRAVETTLSAFGRVDVLVNNAGNISRSGPLRRRFDAHLREARWLFSFILPA